jgi:hypothetical protein
MGGTLPDNQGFSTRTYLKRDGEYEVMKAVERVREQYLEKSRPQCVIDDALELYLESEERGFLKAAAKAKELLIDSSYACLTKEGGLDPGAFYILDVRYVIEEAGLPKDSFRRSLLQQWIPKSYKKNAMEKLRNILDATA